MFDDRHSVLETGDLFWRLLLGIEGVPVHERPDRDRPAKAGDGGARDGIGVAVERASPADGGVGRTTVLLHDELDGPALADLAPGPDLAALLETVDLGDVDDFALVEVVAAWRRVGAWAAARAARAAAVLAARESMNPPWPDAAGTVAEVNVAGDELAMRLACSRSAARSLVRAGLAFEGALGPTGEALEAGLIDEGKAGVLVRALADVPEELAWWVQDAVLPGADRRTRRQLASDVERAMIAIDPEAADARAVAATAGRRVSRPQLRPDGMVGLWAVLPAPAGLALSSHLDAVARRARQADDGRTVEQLRADVLCATVLNAGRSCADPEAHGAAPLGHPSRSGTRRPASRRSWPSSWRRRRCWDPPGERRTLSRCQRRRRRCSTGSPARRCAPSCA